MLDVVQKRGGTVGMAAASSLPTAKKKYCPEEMLNFGAFCRHSIDLVKEEEEEATAWKKSFHHLAFTSVVFATIFALQLDGTLALVRVVIIWVHSIRFITFLFPWRE